MSDTVDVTLALDARTAAWLADPQRRAEAEALLNRTFRQAAVERLIATMEALQAEAAARGLTDEIVEEELAAHKAERRARMAQPET